MKYAFTLLITLFTVSTSFSQFEIRGGMGISFVNMPSVIDYLNQNFAPSNQQLGTFNSAVTFSVEGDYSLDANHEIGLEVAYLVNSHNFSYNLGLYKLYYGIVMPTAIYYYVIRGTGYSFKFGGGIGLRFVSADQQYPATPSAINYQSTGFGFLLKADGNTLLSGNLYANIGVDLRYDINGEPKSSSGSYIVNNLYNKKVNFNSLAACIRLGLTYVF